MQAQTSIAINGRDLPVREHEGKRVVTIKDVSIVHNVPEKNIRRNYERNKKHFVVGTDYFHLKGKKACDNLLHGSKQVTILNVFTESGYLMLAKSLTDDLSWQVQRELVNSYFVRKQMTEGRKQEDTPLAPLKRGSVSGFDLLKLFHLLTEEFKQIIYYRVEKGLTQEETSKILGVSRRLLQRREFQLKQVGIVMPRSYNAGHKFQLTNYNKLNKALQSSQTWQQLEVINER